MWFHSERAAAGLGPSGLTHYTLLHPGILWQPRSMRCLQHPLWWWTRACSPSLHMMMMSTFIVHPLPSSLSPLLLASASWTACCPACWSLNLPLHWGWTNQYSQCRMYCWSTEHAKKNSTFTLTAGGGGGGLNLPRKLLLPFWVTGQVYFCSPVLYNGNIMTLITWERDQWQG